MKVVKSIILRQIYDKNYLLPFAISLIVAVFVSMQLFKTIGSLSGELGAFLFISMLLMLNVTVLFMMLSFLLSTNIIAEKVSGRMEYLASNGVNIKTFTSIYSVSTSILTIFPIVVMDISVVFLLSDYSFLMHYSCGDYILLSLSFLLFAICLIFFLNHLAIVLFNHHTIRTFTVFATFIISFGGSYLISFLTKNLARFFLNPIIIIILILTSLSFTLLILLFVIRKNVTKEKLIFRAKE